MAMAAAASRHVVAVPYPGRGHINPMLVVCRLLAAADSALTVTVVVTEEWHALLAGVGVVSTLPERVRFATIPNVIPSERGRGADPVGFIEAVHAKMGEPVERLLDQLMLERKPEAIVADTYLTWGVAAGARRGIPVCSLWTMPATFFLALYRMDRWPPADACEAEEGQSSKSLDQYVPFPVLSSVKCSDIKIFRSWKLPMKRTAEVFSNVRKAQCVLFTSFYELEACAINAISEAVPYPVYTVGPSIPYLLLKDYPNNHHEQYISWLDAQSKNSVLYVSFGSHVSLSSSQLDKIAMGLHDSAVSFFWVSRDKTTANSLQQIAGDKGLVVPWCDQLKVLCHPAVGGFLSHCGWNSTLEAVFAGVPLLAYPITWDQLVNGRLVANEWKIGINLREQKEKDGTVTSAVVSAAVTKLMDLGNGESQELRRKAAELHHASRSVIEEESSSSSSKDSPRFISVSSGTRFVLQLSLQDQISIALVDLLLRQTCCCRSPLVIIQYLEVPCCRMILEECKSKSREAMKRSLKIPKQHFERVLFIITKGFTKIHLGFFKNAICSSTAAAGSNLDRTR